MRAADNPEFNVTSDEIEAWIRNEETAKHYYSATKRYDDDRAKWLETVHAVRLLERMFTSLTEQKLPYQKTWHGPEIVERMLARDPELLAPLRDELREVLRRNRDAGDKG
jgi:hypothetical protein